MTSLEPASFSRRSRFPHRAPQRLSAAGPLSHLLYRPVRLKADRSNCPIRQESPMGTPMSPVSLAERGAFLRHLTPTHLATPWIALVGPNRRAASIVSISAAGLEVVSVHAYPTGLEMTI